MTDYVYGSQMYYSMSGNDYPLAARYQGELKFALTEKQVMESYDRRSNRVKQLRAEGGKVAVDDAFLKTSEFTPEAVLVMSERKLARMGGVVVGAGAPLLRGATARLFEQFDLGPNARLVEMPIYEPEPDKNGTVKAGPYRLRERAEEGAWLALIVTGERDTISDEHCDERAFSSEWPTGKSWKPRYVDVDKMTMEPGLGFNLTALSGPSIWHEARVLNQYFYFTSELGAAFAELAKEYPSSKRIWFDGVLRFPVAGA
ncbi:MAG: hypothetical protein ABJG88_11545 [Litorimonas sp.]